MIDLTPQEIATEAGAEVITEGGPGHPERAVIDSRRVAAGDLFVGLPGAHADGGSFAADALAAGAWGAIVSADAARVLRSESQAGWLFATPDPLVALQDLARAWRRRLACRVVGVTGSTGKTSVKDICRALLPARVHASPENYNTEIGLPLTVLSAHADTELMVLEMAMRGVGQIAELCRIAEPDVGVITNVGPVHLELLGTIEAVAEAKAEILDGLGRDGRAVVPADAEALEPHLHDQVVTITFGPGGDVFALRAEGQGRAITAHIATPHGEADFAFPFGEAHNLVNALCAVAIGVALDVPVSEMAQRAPEVAFSRLRGELIELNDGIVLVNDCYNANPTSMRAALDHLAALPAAGRRVAILGEMMELGPEAAAYHREIGSHARGAGVQLMVGVGELGRDYAPDHWTPDTEAATALVPDLLEADDVVLVKGSRSVGLEALSEALQEQAGRSS